MLKFPRRKRASDVAGGRFWHPKIEMRAAQEAWTHEAERRTHANKQRDKLLAIIRRFWVYRPDRRRRQDDVIAGHSILSFSTNERSKEKRHGKKAKNDKAYRA